MLRFDARYGLHFDDLLHETHKFINFSRDSRDNDFAMVLGILMTGDALYYTTAHCRHLQFYLLICLLLPKWLVCLSREM